MAVRPVREHDVDAAGAARWRARSTTTRSRAGSTPTGRARLTWSRRFFAWQLRRLPPQDVSVDDRRRQRRRRALGAARSAGARAGARRSSLVAPDAARRAAAAAAGAARARPGRGAPSGRAPPVPRRARRRARPPGPGRRVPADPAADSTLCDREGLPAYLETGKERNLAFYGRHGFRVVDEIRAAQGAAGVVPLA